MIIIVFSVMEVLASCRYDWLISDKHGEKVRSHIVGLYIYKGL